MAADQAATPAGPTHDSLEAAHPLWNVFRSELGVALDVQEGRTALAYELLAAVAGGEDACAVLRAELGIHTDPAVYGADLTVTAFALPGGAQ